MPSWSNELSRPQRAAATISAPPPPLSSVAKATTTSAPPPQLETVSPAPITWHERVQTWCADDSDWNTRAGVAGVVFLLAATILAVVRPPFVLDCDGHRSWKRILTISTVWALLVLALPSALAYWGGK